MIYKPEYFPFDVLKHEADVTQVFATVTIIYAVIFVLSWVYVNFVR